MKTTSITVERNFHIMNDDRFIMEKISVTTEVDKNESEHAIINAARDVIADNFKAAYPHVYTYLNFEEVIQLDKELQKDLQEIERATGKRFFNGEIEATIKKVHGASNYEFMQNLIAQSKPEKINKGTIEEQIEACTTLDELKSFELIAKMNPKLVELWGNKSKKLLVHT